MKQLNTERTWRHWYLRPGTKSHLKHCQTVHHDVVVPRARQEIDAEPPGANLLGKVIQELLWGKKDVCKRGPLPQWAAGLHFQDRLSQTTGSQTKVSGLLPRVSSQSQPFWKTGGAFCHWAGRWVSYSSPDILQLICIYTKCWRLSGSAWFKPAHKEQAWFPSGTGNCF